MSPGQTALDLSGVLRERPVERVEVGPALAVGPRYPALTRGLDPDTSRAAAAKQKGGGVTAAVLRAYQEHPEGLSDDECAALLPQHLGSTVKSARSRLTRKAHLLVDSGRTKPGLVTGSEQTVWRIK